MDHSVSEELALKELLDVRVETGDERVGLDDH